MPPGQWARDLGAGLIVGLVAIPLAIAFAIATGLPPAAGLVTVVVAGTVAALFGGSRVLVTGPAGAFVTLLFGIGFRYGFSNLVLATLMAGVLMVLMGWFRLGALIKFVPYPVTTGFTAGIALVIAVGQLQDVLGLSLAGLPPEPVERLREIAPHLAQTQGWAVALAVGTIAVVQAFKRWAPRVPGPVVALGLFTALASLADLPVVTVADRFGDLPQGIPLPAAPEWSWEAVRLMFPSAVTIALLGAIESLLAAVVSDGMTGQRHDSNQELVGQGAANVASALFGGMAVSGAIARTATSVQNGGRTPLAALVHVAVVVVALYAAAPLVGGIPLSVLAGILLVVAWNMSERHRFLRILRAPPADAGVMVVVFLLTVFMDLTVAVGVGMVLAMAVFMHRMSGATSVAVVDPLRDEAPPAQRFHPDEVPEGVLVYSIDGPFFFGAADRFQETLARVAEAPRVVVLRMRNVPYLDATGLNALESTVEGLRRRGARVLLAAVQSQPMDLMERSGAFRMLGDDAVFRTTSDALRAVRSGQAEGTVRPGPP